MVSADRHRRFAELKARGGIIKICGLREAQHAVTAAEAGADLIGLMFAESRRRISPGDAAMLVAATRATLGEQSPMFVGVFVDETPERINAIASEAGLDAVQLHGAEPSTTFNQADVPIIRAFAPTPDSTEDTVRQDIETQRFGAESPALWLVDAWDPILQGGTGKRANWNLAAGLASSLPFLLAGGLNAENVGLAIEQVRPAGVDVSSGVESDGIKDPVKITAFVEQARDAFGRIQT